MMDTVRDYLMSQIDLSQFVNKKVRATTRNGVEHTDYIKIKGSINIAGKSHFIYKFGVHSHWVNGLLKSFGSDPCGLDIIKIEEVKQEDEGNLRDEIAQLKQELLNLKQEVANLRLPCKFFGRVNLLEYVGKQVEVTFRNGEKNYGNLNKVDNSHYPFLLESWRVLKRSKMMDSLSYSELLGIYAEAKEIFQSSLSWEAKYDLIFSERIRHRVRIDWYDPDTSYEEDVTAFMNGFARYMGDTGVEND